MNFLMHRGEPTYDPETTIYPRGGSNEGEPVEKNPYRVPLIAGSCIHQFLIATKAPWPWRFGSLSLFGPDRKEVMRLWDRCDHLPSFFCWKSYIGVCSQGKWLESLIGFSSRLWNRNGDRLLAHEGDSLALTMGMKFFTFFRRRYAQLHFYGR
jgi:hypothetical protein